MIQLRKLFTPVSSMDADEAKDYMAKHPEGEYVILDVRQPGEYEEEHLPGAKLIPLPELGDAHQQLDPAKPIIVHCAIGGRSRVAAQMLSGMGFNEVYNLSGGIKAYKGHKATGPREMNLEMVRGDETPEEILTLAYGMEKALQEFYETMQGQAADADLKKLFATLAQVEVRHEQRLYEAYRQVAPEPPNQETFAAATVPQTLEGGFNAQEFLQANKDQVQTVPQILDLAMMLETQALDLYLRFADRCSQPATKEVLFAIAGEEKTHLATLGKLLEEKSGKQG